MNVIIRNDPDFKPDARRTIDLRPFFDEPKVVETRKKQWSKDDIDENETFDIDEPIPDEYEEKELPPSLQGVVSPAIRSETRRGTILKTEQEERERSKSIKRVFLEGLLATFETIIIFLLRQFQDFRTYLDPFETKHTEAQLCYLGLSLPNNVRTADQILLYYPLLSRTQRYKMLRMRRDKLAMYRKIYEKRR